MIFKEDLSPLCILLEVDLLLQNHLAFQNNKKFLCLLPFLEQNLSFDLRLLSEIGCELVEVHFRDDRRKESPDELDLVFDLTLDLRLD